MVFAKVNGVGSFDSKIAVFGEAAHPAGAGTTGIPLTSKTSGRAFTAALEACGLKREDIYISNVIKEPTVKTFEEMISLGDL